MALPPAPHGPSADAEPSQPALWQGASPREGFQGQSSGTVRRVPGSSPASGRGASPSEPTRRATKSPRLQRCCTGSSSPSPLPGSIQAAFGKLRSFVGDERGFEVPAAPPGHPGRLTHAAAQGGAMSDFGFSRCSSDAFKVSLRRCWRPSGHSTIQKKLMLLSKI